jgi:hypothetical protein
MAGFVDGLSDAEMARATSTVTTRFNRLKDRFKLLSFTQDDAEVRETVGSRVLPVAVVGELRRRRKRRLSCVP